MCPCSFSRESFARKLVLEKRTSKCRLTGLREETLDDDALKVGIIGGGHLGKQLAHTLLQFIPIPAENLRISTRRPETLGEEHWAGHLERAPQKRNPCIQLAEFLAC